MAWNKGVCGSSGTQKGDQQTAACYDREGFHCVVCREQNSIVDFSVSFSVAGNLTVESKSSVFFAESLYGRSRSSRCVVVCCVVVVVSIGMRCWFSTWNDPLDRPQQHVTDQTDYQHDRP